MCVLSLLDNQKPISQRQHLVCSLNYNTPTPRNVPEQNQNQAWSLNQTYSVPTFVEESEKKFPG